MTYEGGCLCGRVRWKAEGDPINVGYCHCRQCQLALGGPYFARAVFPQDKVEVDGHTEKFPSSERLWRVFCKECGTRLFGERSDGSVMGIGLATFDDPNALKPAVHMFVSEKVGWFEIDDGLPQHPQRPGQ